MTASYILGASTASGAALVAGSTIAMAVGSGLLTGAAMAFIAYINSDKKAIEGTVIAIPQRTVEDAATDGRGPMVTRG
jgi:hypothetical protein